MFGKKLAFWVAVGGVALLSSFALELAAAKTKLPGLQKLANFVHNGPGGSA